MSSSDSVVKQSSSGKRFTFRKPPTAAVGPHIPPPPVPSAPKQIIEVENIEKPQCKKQSSFGRQITDLTNDDDDDFFQMDSVFYLNLIDLLLFLLYFQWMLSLRRIPIISR